MTFRPQTCLIMPRHKVPPHPLFEASVDKVILATNGAKDKGVGITLNSDHHRISL